MKNRSEHGTPLLRIAVGLLVVSVVVLCTVFPSLGGPRNPRMRVGSANLGSGPSAVELRKTLPDDVVGVALNSILVGKDSDVGGSLIVNTISPGPIFLDEGVHIAVDRDATVGDLQASTVDLDRKAAAGVICSDDLTAHGQATFSGGDPDSYSNADPAPCDDQPPIVETLPLFESASPGPSDLDVLSGSQTISGGSSFKDITVGGSATLVFAGGTTARGDAYSAESISLGQDAKLLFEGATDLLVSDTFDTQKNAEVRPCEATDTECDEQQAGSFPTASQIVVFVDGANPTPDDPNSVPHPANVGQQNTARANFYVRDGTFQQTVDGPRELYKAMSSLPGSSALMAAVLITPGTAG